VLGERGHGGDGWSGTKDGRFGEGEEKMTWHGGIHELGMKIGKLPEQNVFYG
jgi:hypothetical protein